MTNQPPQAAPAPMQQAPMQQAPAQWQGAPAATYTSPIPIRSTHLGHALASEWTKIRSVRSTMWTLGVMFLLVLGISTMTAVGLSGSTYAEIPLLSGGLFGLMLGQICIVTLGVLVITSEYGTGMIRTTMTACPARGRVLAAKAIVFFSLSFTMTLVATTLTALIQSAMLGGKSPGEFSTLPKDSIVNGEVVATTNEWLDATVGASLYVALLGLLALAVGAVLRHSAGAITTMLAVILLPLLLALFMQMESLRDLQEALIEYSPLNGLATLYQLPFMGDEGSGSGWGLLGILACVTVAALAGAFALTHKRDV
ncbi:ABC transporter permease subunit [Streptomyces sp. YC504]|uniref:ABC transporter permease subunit n=1 Tax=Streptomyces mesophilus TaxID=1775132 RepID=A0A6G4XIG9_9ACTN|nr:ABC transporter permease [Streptomyces mesophilus]NGO76431.1 ABC transporter permease subunit [Streptomyces mesophilus]